MSIGYGAGIASHIAQTVGEDISSSLSGVAQLIAESADNARLNREAALTLSTRVKDYVDIISSAISQAGTRKSDAEWHIGLKSFLATLIDTKRQLEDQARESCLTHILRRERDGEKLHILSERVRNAFGVLMLRSQIQLQELAETTAQSLQTILDSHIDSQTPPAVAAPTAAYRGPSIPPPPSLHFGRTAETQMLADLLTGDSAAIVAVLGGPGMGKTSLAVTAAHEPAVAAIYGANRYFVACDAADEQPSCLNIVCGAFGISMTNASTARKLLSRTLTACRCLLVLDNFESAWDRPVSRSDAEEFLAFIASLHGPSLVITLRGSERPQGVPWTRPFLYPLRPLDDDSSRQVFVAIADPRGPEDNLTKLLSYLDNVPLALVLMANLASYEPLHALLVRWDAVKTAMLTRSDGRSRLTSLNVSVQLSLDSPRMQEIPEALRLISSLSLLPQGIAESDIRFCLSPHLTARRALSTLLRNALAYRTSEHRIRVLAPIREFVLTNCLPAQEDVQSLSNHYFELVQGISHDRLVTPALISAAAPEVDNISSLTRIALESSSDPRPAVLACVGMTVVLHTTGMGSFEALIRALAVARQNNFLDLAADLLFYWAKFVLTGNHSILGDPVELWSEARVLYEQAGNVRGAGYCALELATSLPPDEALDTCIRVLSVAEEDGNIAFAAQCHGQLAYTYQRLGKSIPARASYLRAIDLSNADDTRTLAQGYWLFRLADLDLDCGLVVSAVSQLKQSCSLLEAAHSRYGAGEAYVSLGKCLLLQGDIQSAISQLSSAQKHYTAVAYLTGMLECSQHMAEAYMAACDDSSAAEEVAMAERSIQAPGEPGRDYNIQLVLQAKARAALARGDMLEARVASLAAVMTARRGCRYQNAETMLYAEAQAHHILGQAEQSGSSSSACIHQIVAAIVFRSLGIQVDTVMALLHLAPALDDDVCMLLLRSIMPPLQRFGFLPALAQALLSSAEFALRDARPALARHRATHAVHHYGRTQHLAGRTRAEAFLAECL